MTRLSADNYKDKGAGFFMMWIGELGVEVMGRRGNLSLQDPVFDTRVLPWKPTRIQIGPDYWASTNVNPGANIRLKYVHGYLRHVQSWR